MNIFKNAYKIEDICLNQHTDNVIFTFGNLYTFIQLLKN